MNKLGWAYREPSISDRSVLLELLDQHPHIEDTAAEVESMYKKSVARPFASEKGTFFYYVFRHIDTEAAHHFMLGLYGLEAAVGNESNPVMHLHQRLMRAKQSMQRGQKLNSRVIDGSIVNAWNLHIQGFECKSSRSIILQFNQEFPDIKDCDGKVVCYEELVW